MNFSSPSMTLVVPTYNRGDMIAETLDSALAQQPAFHEIIVVDDGSTDDTTAVLARYGGRVQLITVANGGVQRARNTGVAAASGEFIVLCDSDDLFEPGYVATMQSWLQRQRGSNCVYSNFVTFNERGVQADKFSGAPAGFFDGALRDGDFWHALPDLYARILAYQPLFPSGSLMRRSLYVQMGGYDTAFSGVGAEDYEFALRTIDTTDVALCALPLMRIRKHANNDSADNIRTVYGTIQILLFALQHHAGAKQHRQAVLGSIDERRLDVFNGAFASGAFEIAAEMLSSLRPAPRDRKFFVKAMITKLPAALRTPLWRMTQ